MFRKQKRLFLVFALLLVMGLLVVGCSNDSPTTPPDTNPPDDQTQQPDTADPTASDEPVYDENATVTYAIATGWETMVPFYWSTSGMAGTLVWEKMYDTLVAVHFDGSYTERGAVSWEQSEDKKTMTFKLAENAKFHDGQPVTAYDWEFTAQLLTHADFVTPDGTKLTPLFAGTDDSGKEVSDKSVGVKAVDDYTLEIAFKNPISFDTFFNTYMLYYWVLPKHLLADIAPADLQTDSFWDNPIGSGAWKYDSQTAGTEITFVRNEDYHLGSPHFAKLNMRVLGAANYASAFMAGEIDIAYPRFTVDEGQALMDYDNLVVKKHNYPTYLYFFCINHELIPDVRVRQAMNLMVDKELIAAQLFQGEAVATESVEIPGSEFYNTDLTTKRDLARAKELLDEAGWDYDTVLTLATPADTREKVAAIIQQNFAENDFKIEITTLDIGAMYGGLQNGTYPMGMMNGMECFDPLYQNTNFDYRANTFYKIKDPRYVELAEEITVAPTHEEYLAKIWEYQQYMYDQATMVPIVTSYEYAAISSRLVNCEPFDTYRSCDFSWQWQVLAQ